MEPVQHLRFDLEFGMDAHASFKDDKEIRRMDLLLRQAGKLAQMRNCLSVYAATASCVNLLRYF